MTRTLLILFSVSLLSAGMAVGETVILDENFGSWSLGTIDGTYTLPGGWSMLVAGMQVTNEYAYSGRTLKCPDNSLGALRFSWTPVDPTTANPLKVVIYMQLGSQAKVEKGAVLLNADAQGGACEPAVYWHENTGDNTKYQVRDRENCDGETYTSVYGSSATTHVFDSADLTTRVKWEIICDDTNAELFKDDISVGTFAGAPNGTMDNFVALDVGVPKTNWWTSDFSDNGDIWFDRIQIIQGPFGPDPTPTPLPGEVRLTFRDDFESYGSYGEVTGVWTIDAGSWQFDTSVNHTGGGSKSLKNVTDSKAEQNAEVFWQPQEPLSGYPIRVSFWWRFDATGAGHDKLDKFARLTNDRAGQTGTSAIAFGPYWSGAVGNGLVDGRPTSYANLDGTYAQAACVTTDLVWWEWVFEAYPTHCTITANGTDFMACCGFTSGSGAPNADVVANPWNAFHVGCFYGTSLGRGNFWLDDVAISGVPTTGLEDRDWASY